MYKFRSWQQRHLLFLLLWIWVLAQASIAQADIIVGNASSASSTIPSVNSTASAANGSPTVDGANRYGGMSSTGFNYGNSTFGATTGQVQVLVLVWRGLAGAATTITVPAGWATLVPQTSRDTGGINLSIAVYYHVTDTGTDPTTWSFPMTNVIAGSSTIYIISDVDTSAAGLANFKSAGQITDSGITIPALTPAPSSPGFSILWYVEYSNDCSGNLNGNGFCSSASATATSPATTWTAQNLGNTGSSAPAGGIRLYFPGIPTRITPRMTSIAGQVLVAVIGASPSTGYLASDITITPPVGWNLINRTNNDPISGAAKHTAAGLYYKVATGGDSDTWTITNAACTAAAIDAFTGIDTSALPPSPSYVSAANFSAGTISSPSLNINALNSANPNSYPVVVSTFVAAGSNFFNFSGAPPQNTKACANYSPAVVASLVALSPSSLPWGVPAMGTATISPAGNYAGIGQFVAFKGLPDNDKLKLSVPAGTQPGDVMVATMAVNPVTTAVATPAGWTFVGRITSPASTTADILDYWRTADASDIAGKTYDWTLAGYKNAAGGIVSMAGVNTSAPINAFLGASYNAFGGSQLRPAPSVTPSVAGTMLLTSHARSTSSPNWVSPNNMVGAFSINATGVSMQSNYAVQGVAGVATGVVNATTLNSSGGASSGFSLLLQPAGIATVIPAAFNAVNSGENPVNGKITSKIAGSAFNLDIVALDGSALLTTFTSNVKVELLASNALPLAALDANGCPSAATVLQTIGTVGLTNGFRNVTFLAPNTAWRNARVRISYPATAPTKIVCSTDNFAIRPKSFGSISVKHDDWTTATVSSSSLLSNLSLAVTGPIKLHKAGQPLTVVAYALSSTGFWMRDYTHTGAINGIVSSCATDAACTALGSNCACSAMPTGLFSLPVNATFVNGYMTTSSASYNDVGAFNLQLQDQTFADVDINDTVGDCSTSGRYICSSLLNVGRFVPDYFDVTGNTPLFHTGCDGFTYLGQPFNYQTAPVLTVTARNAAGAITPDYTGNLWRLAASNFSGGYATASGSLTPMSVSSTTLSNTAGVGTITVVEPGFSFTRPTLAASPFNAEIGLTISMTADADNVGAMTPAITFGSGTAGNGIGFSNGVSSNASFKTLRYGRLKMQNAYGSELLALPIPLEAQYWNGFSYVKNLLDSCTTVAAASIAMSNYQKNLSESLPSCETQLGYTSGTGAFVNGESKFLRLTKPGAGNNGSVDLTINLNTVSGKTCITATESDATSANIPWFGTDPTSRATFGIYKTPIIYMRENF
jgi:MSHA biogenesis protein MshQ